MLTTWPPTTTAAPTHIFLSLFPTQRRLYSTAIPFGQKWTKKFRKHNLKLLVRNILWFLLMMVVLFEVIKTFLIISLILSYHLFTKLKFDWLNLSWQTYRMKCKRVFLWISSLCKVFLFYSIISSINYSVFLTFTFAKV